MSDVIVEVEGVSKTFGEVNAVEDFSFSVERGEVYGLLGPNGAGKSTTLRMITGLERPTKGVTRLFGTTVTSGCAELTRVGAIVEQQRSCHTSPACATFSCGGRPAARTFAMLIWRAR